MTEENKSRVNRRTVLKATTAAAGLGLPAPVTARDQGSVQFSESRIVHDVSIPSSDEFTYPFTHVDEFGHSRVVDEEESVLYINEQYAKDHLDIANQKNSVVAGKGLSGLPTKLGNCQKSNIVTEVLDDFRATKLLSVSGDYRMPLVSMSNQQDELVVESNGKKTTVSPGEKAQIPLPKKEVTVEVFRTVEKDPEEVTVEGGEDWQQPWRKPNPREYVTKTVTVTPWVVAQNYGKLDVVSVRSKAPNYHPNQ